MTLLAIILSEWSNGGSARNSKSLLSSSADRDKRLFINGLPTHNAKRTGGLYRAKRRKGRPSDAHGYALMFVSGIDPHGLRFSGSLETHCFVKFDGFAVCGKHLLMKAAVDPLHCLHDFPTNTRPLVVRMHQ